MSDNMQSSSEPKALRVVIAGGGTGGHLFPGLAIAQEFMARNKGNRVVFISTGNPLERSVLGQTDFRLESVTAEGIKGRGLWNQAKSALKIPKGIMQALRILKDYRPDLTVGLGSYSAGPVVVSAWLLRTKIVLHEQNILPGITNRILARFADRIYVSFDDTQARFAPHKIRLTGNPVRQELLNNHNGQPITPELKKFCVLIIGGSQGAHRINTTLIEALGQLTQKEELFFIHQTGAADEQMVSEAYRRANIAAKVQSFFTQMGPLYKQADLIICRAGATTVAEVTAMGKAVIFIPFPFAADDHQTLNAATLANKGAAEMIHEKDINAGILAQRIEYYASHPQALETMALKAGRLGHPDAAQRIVDDCYDLVKSSNS
ncbi:MAG: undecaprenyldiphospho-muramoylpentapeptide beta-N-acetylglucosaminyltransferase [Deltaproteobacteria bacterium]|jgi:UDP-N-acetylglucosamine--N-acetylmuramyl-(pentapeptide) pyrophosphoryl-undecaprenol N-acetylglucosamine transferase|nr:undecaprenyldiphospho-muramoylpentapeptide beta-N-acetylglucosaminyltransferase [Deltaproteobacteria bacterium]